MGGTNSIAAKLGKTFAGRVSLFVSAWTLNRGGKNRGAAFPKKGFFPQTMKRKPGNLLGFPHSIAEFVHPCNRRSANRVSPTPGSPTNSLRRRALTPKP